VGIAKQSRHVRRQSGERKSIQNIQNSKYCGGNSFPNRRRKLHDFKLQAFGECRVMRRRLSSNDQLP
jgi:hypothetical protein